MFEKYPIQKTILSSVTNEFPDLVASLNRFSVVYILNNYTPIPIVNLYKTPASLGMDRLASAIGAWSLDNAKSILSIDSGTCTTYDYINSKSEYIGGAISPGLTMRLKAMNYFTNKLPLLEEITFRDIVGGTTVESINSGALQGLKFEIEGYIQYFNTVSEQPIMVYITGGDAELLVDQLKSSIFAPQIQIEKHLVLIGLNQILQYQK
ncbi:MAG: type III pantothenate kinase [Bacteroidetes bacterium]|nr:type III pantothenate kinase [Bacteroidota bacterium]